MTAHDGFRPAWWLAGAHAQTLGARLLRSGRGVRLRRERLELPDGDFLDLDWVEAAAGVRARRSGPLVLVLHGLEGSSQSKYALEMYRALLPRGLDAVGMNFRSCSGEPNRLPRLYHSGDTGDVSHVLTVLGARYPERPLGAVGFSLGGNVLLKFLGERGDGAPLRAAVAISVPFDLAAGAAYLEHGFSRVYRRYLIRRLMRKVRAKRHLVCDLVDVERALAARTFREFDEVTTAVLHGFAGAEDYYRRSSSAQFVHAIRVATLIVHAVDDPFLPGRAIPRDAVARNPHVTACLTGGGGHVGFVAGSPWAPIFWGEREGARFLAARLSLPMPSPQAR